MKEAIDFRLSPEVVKTLRILINAGRGQTNMGQRRDALDLLESMYDDVTHEPIEPERKPIPDLVHAWPKALVEAVNRGDLESAREIFIKILPFAEGHYVSMFLGGDIGVALTILGASFLREARQSAEAAENAAHGEARWVARVKAVEARLEAVRDAAGGRPGQRASHTFEVPNPAIEKFEREFRVFVAAVNTAYEMHMKRPFRGAFSDKSYVEDLPAEVVEYLEKHALGFECRHDTLPEVLAKIAVVLSKIDGVRHGG